MNIVELLLIAVGLSMDAFAVSVCTGLSVRQSRWKAAITAGLYFGMFQMIMPLAGYLLGIQFADYISDYDHWIALALLSFIGGKMIKESFSLNEAASCKVPSLKPKEMLPLAVATSIDALAVGVSLAFLKVSILPAVMLIGATTLILSMIGVGIGSVFGAKFKSKAELVGGILLILMGIRIVFDHLNIL